MTDQKIEDEAQGAPFERPTLTPVEPDAIRFAKALRETDSTALDAFTAQTLIDAADELERLHKLINTPHIEDFVESVRLEAIHQIERWGDSHDRNKGPGEWYWLVAYLASKALRAHTDNNREKALHHTISTAAALANWHRYMQIDFDRSVDPDGPSDLKEMVGRNFGEV